MYASYELISKSGINNSGFVLPSDYTMKNNYRNYSSVVYLYFTVTWWHNQELWGRNSGFRVTGYKGRCPLRGKGGKHALFLEHLPRAWLNL